MIERRFVIDLFHNYDEISPRQLFLLIPQNLLDW